MHRLRGLELVSGMLSRYLGGKALCEQSGKQARETGRCLFRWRPGLGAAAGSCSGLCAELLWVGRDAPGATAEPSPDRSTGATLTGEPRGLAGPFFSPSLGFLCASQG